MTFSRLLYIEEYFKWKFEMKTVNKKFHHFHHSNMMEICMTWCASFTNSLLWKPWYCLWTIALQRAAILIRLLLQSLTKHLVQSLKFLFASCCSLCKKNRQGNSKLYYSKNKRLFNFSLSKFLRDLLRKMEKKCLSIEEY